MTSTSKSFSHIASLVAGIWGLKAFDPSGYINLISFCYVSFHTQKVKIVIKKKVHIHLSFTDPKIKIFRDSPVFVLSLTPKNENSEITKFHKKTIILKCLFIYTLFYVDIYNKSIKHSDLYNSLYANSYTNSIQ